MNQPFLVNHHDAMPNQQLHPAHYDFIGQISNTNILFTFSLLYGKTGCFLAIRETFVVDEWMNRPKYVDTDRQLLKVKKAKL